MNFERLKVSRILLFALEDGYLRPQNTYYWDALD